MPELVKKIITQDGFSYVDLVRENTNYIITLAFVLLTTIVFGMGVLFNTYIISLLLLIILLMLYKHFKEVLNTTIDELKKSEHKLVASVIEEEKKKSVL